MNIRGEEGSPSLRRPWVLGADLSFTGSLGAEAPEIARFRRNKLICLMQLCNLRIILHTVHFWLKYMLNTTTCRKRLQYISVISMAYMLANSYAIFNRCLSHVLACKVISVFFLDGIGLI